MKIHKRNIKREQLAGDGFCGRWFCNYNSSYLWKNVTCKKCLKLRGFIEGMSEKERIEKGISKIKTAIEKDKKRKEGKA